MAYKGGVPVNSGFYPRNDFPIVEAKDVYVSDEKRLDAALEELSSLIGDMSTSEHDHDDRYYTEVEVDTKLSEINTNITNITSGEVVVKESEHAGSSDSADEAVHAGSADSATTATSATQDGSGNVISDTYETKSDAGAKLTEAKTYADSVGATVKNDLLNGAGEAYDTLKELGDLIKENVDAIDALETIASGKANSDHNHDGVYDAFGTAEEKMNVVQGNLNTVSGTLTEHINNADVHFTAEEREKLNNISEGANVYVHPDSGVVAGTYKSVTVDSQGHVTEGSNPTTLEGYGITDAESKGAADAALASAKEYTDSAIATEVENRNKAISTAVSNSDTKVSEALASAKSYADSVGTTVKNDLLNGAGEAYDTLKELGDLIDDNVGAIEALTAIASDKADADHVHDDRYYTEDEIDEMIVTMELITTDDIDAICNGTI